MFNHINNLNLKSFGIYRWNIIHTWNQQSKNKVEEIISWVS